LPHFESSSGVCFAARVLPPIAQAGLTCLSFWRAHEIRPLQAQDAAGIP
jgi:hypothetical protein